MFELFNEALVLSSEVAYLSLDSFWLLLNIRPCQDHGRSQDFIVLHSSWDIVQVEMVSTHILDVSVRQIDVREGRSNNCVGRIECRLRWDHLRLDPYLFLGSICIVSFVIERFPVLRQNMALVIGEPALVLRLRSRFPC